MNISRVRRPWRSAAVAVIAGAVLLSSGCGRGTKSPSWQNGGDKQTAAGGGTGSSADPSPSPTLSTVAVVSPAANATNVVAATEVKYTSDDPENTSVTVTDADGSEIKGTLDTDEKTWRPEKALAYGTKYTVTVTGTAAGGKGGSTTSTFTTMAKP